MNSILYVYVICTQIYVKKYKLHHTEVIIICKDRSVNYLFQINREYINADNFLVEDVQLDGARHLLFRNRKAAVPPTEGQTLVSGRHVQGGVQTILSTDEHPRVHKEGRMHQTASAAVRPDDETAEAG